MKRALVAAASVFVAAIGFGGCYSEHEGKLSGGRTPGDGSGGAAIHADASAGGGGSGGDASTGGQGGSTEPIACKPARAGEKLPARSAVMAAAPVEQKRTMLVGELFSEFDTKCGSCHVDLANGDWQVARATFATDISKNELGEDIGTAAYDRIFDEEDPMPENIAPPSQRDPKSDPYLQLGEKLKAWFEQGKPTDFFEPPVENVGNEPPVQSYLLTKAVGEALTNLGNCIPDRLAMSDTGDALDERFAGDALPDKLADTDLTTLDSAELARHGVIAYAPAYPLWSDDAHKIRHVRVPRGQSIVFHKNTQSFEIPENTRFYKTFSRKVIEKDGQERYRKMETRLIVARAPEMVNGELVQRALFGTYEWNDDETEAELSKLPRIDQKPFADHLRPYTTDEAKYDEVLAAHQPGQDLTRALQNAGAIRHYAQPGSERCIRCHMGSPNDSFTLGFLPLQIKWRPNGEGGVIETPEEDELNQLQRLIDYGVVTGIESPDDVVNLEDSQGDRKPRNDEELVAQGYLLGNCAHCHNPKGYPTVQNPELRDLLNFLPGPGADEGVFQFPLERYSPRIGRGPGGVTRMPYITPSLVDFPSKADFNRTAAYDGLSATDGAFRPEYLVLAPWRSLIYRNVDTPFPYSVDVALFPHMPMDTPGFDCRAPRILGEWMVSIPSLRKSKYREETLVQASLPLDQARDTVGTDENEQPYKEVRPGEHAYDVAASDALERLRVYKTGDPSGVVLVPPPLTGEQPRFYSRHQYCVETIDTVDPTVTGGDKRHLVPSDLRYMQSTDENGEEIIIKVPTNYDPVRGYPRRFGENLEPLKSTDIMVWPDEGVPDRPHWVSVESGEPPGEWAPRRSDWKKFLVEGQIANSSVKTDEEKRTERLTLELLKNAKLTARVRDVVSKPIAFGLWKNNPGCEGKFARAGVKTIAELEGEKPLWVQQNPEATPEARAYSVLPGAAVYNMVCVNCHGPRADSRGRQADTLQFMTGGDARVANFINGLFGPADSPGANMTRVFDAGQGLTAQDWAARYLAWMALGGTEKLIPKGILNVVSVTPVLGHVRVFEGVDSANMLGPVQFLCAELHGYRGREQNKPEDLDNPYRLWSEKFPDFDSKGSLKNLVWDQMVENARVKGVFLKTIGDPELWATLCALDNPMPIRILDLNFLDAAYRTNIAHASRWPSGARVGNHRGTVDDGLQPTNLLPWCVRPFIDPDRYAKYTTADGLPLPVCPEEVYNSQEDLVTVRQVEEWSYRGAISAGFAVFSYLNELSKGLKPVPPHDRCEDLQ